MRKGIALPRETQYGVTPVRCKVVQISGGERMASKGKRSRQAKSARASVSFPAPLYAELSRIAEQRKVSVAWVVRDAAEKYIADQYPLFGS